MTIEFLDPTHEGATALEGFSLAPSLASLAGTTIAIVSNGKKNTGPFFDAVARDLKTRHGVAEIVTVVKSNYSAPVEADRLRESEKWQALISGVGD